MQSLPTLSYPIPNPRLHRNLVTALVDNLEAIFFMGKMADKVIPKSIKSNKKWGKKDREFVAFNSYEMVRNHSMIAHFCPPTYAYSYHFIGCWWQILGFQLPDWEEFKGCPVVSLAELKELTLSTRWSVPEWLMTLLSSQLGDSANTFIENSHSQAPVFLRVNTLKTNAQKLKDKLVKDDIETQLISENKSALELKSKKQVNRHALFSKGFFEFQDLNSQKIAPFLEVEPHQTVIDACAGSGGKSLHLATLMQNKGRLICFDLFADKLERLQKRTERHELNCVEIHLIEQTNFHEAFAEQADRLLLDVPCSGLGTMRRHADLKWKLSEEKVKDLISLQAKLLQQYSQMLKPGGKLVYATCSVLKDENENQIKNFLKDNSNFKLEVEKSYLPMPNGGDGFYMARLAKN